MEFIGLSESPNPKKKYRAYFNTGKYTDFGDSSMEDYTQHHDKDRRANYRSRHKRDLNTHDPTRAGFLSFFLLWGDSTNMETNIANYKQLFNL